MQVSGQHWQPAKRGSAFVDDMDAGGNTPGPGNRRPGGAVLTAGAAAGAGIGVG